MICFFFWSLLTFEVNVCNGNDSELKSGPSYASCSIAKHYIRLKYNSFFCFSSIRVCVFPCSYNLLINIWLKRHETFRIIWKSWLSNWCKLGDFHLIRSLKRFNSCLFVVRLLVKMMAEHGFCSSFDLYRWCALAIIIIYYYSLWIVNRCVVARSFVHVCSVFFLAFSFC